MSKISKRPKFSIITVSYNHDQYIHQTIESVLNQTFNDFEYLIVDGNSKDNSRKVIEKYTQDSRIKAIFQKSNEGAVSGLNEGFKNARGEFLGYINSDDLYLKNTLKDVENIFLNNPSIDVVFGNSYIINDKNIIVKDFISKDFSFKRLKFREYLVCQQATFFKKEFFDKTNGFNPLNKRSWDFELFVDMIKTGAKYKRIGNFLGCFRIYEGTITSKGNSENRKKNLDYIYNKYFTKPLTFNERIEKIFMYFFDRLNLNFIFNAIKVLYYKIVKIKISNNEK